MSLHSVTLSSADAPVGDALDVAGLTLEVSKSDGSTQTIAVTADMVSGFDSNKVGKQVLTVTYEGYTDTYEVEVRDVEPPDEVDDRFKVEARDGAPVISVSNAADVVRATLTKNELAEGCLDPRSCASNP